MAVRSSFNFNRKRKRKKIITTVSIAAAIVLAALFIIGVTVGSDDRDDGTVSAVEENTYLKQQVSEMQAQIDELNAQIEELQSELDSRPTPSPTQDPNEENEGAGYGGRRAQATYSPLSPREGIRSGY